MSFNFIDLFQLLGSLAIFIFGMKIMSQGLQQAAGSRMKGIMRWMTSNRFMGVFTGFMLTVLLQTSSGTTVMVVSFVNAGLLSLIQAMGVIMGANIGTTLTAWMIYLFGYRLDILAIAIPAMGIALPFYFSKNKFRQGLAEFVIGFGVLFIGIEFLKESVPNIQDNPEILSFLEAFTQQGIWSILLFIFFGTLLTITVQSSSAATAITLALIAQGYIDFTFAAAIFLGENIGTTITANLAALVGNVHAKRAARFHLLFNLTGVFWILLVFSPFLNFIDWIMTTNMGISPFSEDISARGEYLVLAVSIFHTLFNVTNMIIFIGFLKFFEKLVIWIQPSKGDTDEEFHLKYITSQMGNSPEVSLIQARKAVSLFTHLLIKMSTNFRTLLHEKYANTEKLLDKMRKREELTDNMELEIADYLTSVSEFNLSHEASITVRSYMSIINDLEGIGDLYLEMSKNFERMKELRIELPQDALNEISDMHDLIHNYLKFTRRNIEDEDLHFPIQDAYRMEDKIDNKRDELRMGHFERLEQGIYSPQAGVIYLDFITRLEKIGDQLLNINEALAGGKQILRS